MKKKLVFPNLFWWGAASSGPQTEGQYGKVHENVMDYWFKTHPEDFFDNVGPLVASNFFHTYTEDFHLMKEIGVNSFRTSIQWSRLIKNLETGEPDPKGIAFYNAIIEEAKKNQMDLVMNLHHFDLPVELLQKYGGWESKHVVELFVKFAKTAFTCFGDKVHYWTTFNEPMVIPEAGYLYAFHYPNLKGKGKEAVQVIYNLNLASAKVIQLYRSLELDGKIGIILNLTPAYPRSNSPEDLEASRFTEDFFNKVFLNPAVKGTFPERLVKQLERDGVLWSHTEKELQLMKSNTVDFLGVNYYHPKRVQAQANPEEYQTPWMPDQYFKEYEWPERRMNPYRGWEIFPKAIYDIAMIVKEEYDNIPWFISENGRDFENPLAASMLSLVSLIVMMPNTVSVVPDGAKDAVNISGVLSFNNTGTGAMFAGVIVAIIATELFIELSNVKALQMNLGENIPPAVSRSFSVLLPVMTVISLFGVVSALLFNITGMNLISIITIFIQEPIRHIGTSLIGVIIIYSLGNMLWLFGIHQAVIYSAILEPLLLINITENITAANNGQAIPHIINLSQIQTFALMGGSGSTLCLLIATFLVSRNAVSKNVAKLSFGPGIFNINEPVLFGYPIVYNISLAIPFITVPVLGILISYLATVTGFMSPAFIQVPWTTPVFLNAWLATAGDVRAVLVQFIIFALGVLLYIPFIKVNDKVVEQEMEG